MSNNHQAQIILASASPRRRELLEQIQIAYQVLPVDIDESQRPNEPAKDYVQRLALQKAQAGYQQSTTQLPALGSDTAVVLNNKIIGKPKNKQDALAILRALSDNQHQVYTAVAMVNAQQSAIELSISQVTFCHLTDTQILAYWNTGEPLDKAGAYGIQGVAAQFIKQLNGSYSGVMGLPLMETANLLRQFAVPVL